MNLAYIVPGAALASALLLAIAAVALHFRSHLRRAVGALVGVLLVGYALFHRTFAYIGVPPLYIGELVLGVAVVAGLVKGRLRRLLESPVAIAIVVFQAIGVVATAPYIATFGLEALRDAVIWGYACLALAILVLARADTLNSAISVYRKCFVFFVVLIPIMVALGRFAPAVGELLSFRGISLLDPKSGDLAVHLAAIAAFIGLGLHRTSTSAAKERSNLEWLWWTSWLISFALISDNRGGMMAIAVSGAVFLLLSRDAVSLWKPAVIAITLVSLAAAWQVEVGSPDNDRLVSVSSIVHRVQSAFVETGDASVDGTKQWRLNWWADILEYTFGGPYRWLGKGYGINLADADGYQVMDDGSLRSPHNGHLSILARSGVIGLSTWAIFLALLLVPLARSASPRNTDPSSRAVSTWLLVYLVAALVNMTFDVYLEGPQGGLWFWALVGAALTHLAYQRRPQASLDVEHRGA